VFKDINATVVEKDFAKKDSLPDLDIPSAKSSPQLDGE